LNEILIFVVKKDDNIIQFIISYKLRINKNINIFLEIINKCLYTKTVTYTCVYWLYLVNFMLIQYILKYGYSEIKLIKNRISFLKNDKILFIAKIQNCLVIYIRGIILTLKLQLPGKRNAFDRWLIVVLLVLIFLCNYLMQFSLNKYNLTTKILKK